MGTISERIALFNEAHRIGWELMTADDQLPESKRPVLRVRLAENIRTLMEAGRDDAFELAAEAVKYTKTVGQSVRN